MAPRMETVALLVGIAIAATLLASGPGVAAATNKTEQTKCAAQAGICYQKVLKCPDMCKSRTTEGPGTMACFLDCVNCEATCKHRKVNCFGVGAMCYDPRLVGGDGTVFYFHGRKDEDFCLVSDRNLHVNAHFIGLRPQGRPRDFTWVQAVGVLFGDHKISVAAKKVSVWDDAVDQILLSYDGSPFELEEVSGATWVSEDGQLRMQRTFTKNTVEVIAGEVMSLLINVVPITKEYSKAHDYEIPDNDVFAHLDLQFSFHNISANVNGLLGETYQPDFVSKAKKGVKMPIVGGEDRFFATGLLNPDCKATQFVTHSSEELLDFLQPFETDCSHENSGNGGMVCRR